MQGHLNSLERVRDELDAWGDFEQSESWVEHFPEAIENDKNPQIPPHPLWIAGVELQKYYPKRRLPKLTGALDAWANLLKYSRQHGNQDRITQRDLAVENAKLLREWVCIEIQRVSAAIGTGRTDGGTTSAETSPVGSPLGFLGGAALANALGIHATRRNAFFRQLERQRKSLGDDSWNEVREPRPNCPRFLYWVDSPKLRDLAMRYQTPKST